MPLSSLCRVLCPELAPGPTYWEWKSQRRTGLANGTFEEGRCGLGVMCIREHEAA